MAGAKMLVKMNANRALFRDACANSIRALNLFGPYAPKPYAPIPEPVGQPLVPAVMYGDSLCIAQQNDVPCVADDGIQTIHLFLCLENNVLEWFSRNFEFAVGDDVGRGPAFRIEVMVNHRSPPGFGYWVATVTLNLAVQYGLDVVWIRRPPPRPFARRVSVHERPIFPTLRLWNQWTLSVETAGKQ